MGVSQVDRSVPRPLVLCGDADLLDELIRVCAAADLEPEVAAEPGDADDSWLGAPVVLVGEDLVESLSRAVVSGRLGRRTRVFLVTRRAESEQSSLWRLGIAIGASGVYFLPVDALRLVEHLVNGAEGDGPGAPVVGVVGGRGGAGASTLAVALAVGALRRDRVATLLDVDPLGGGLDVLLSWGAEGRRWSEFSGAQGPLPATVLTGERLGARPVVVSWGRDAELDLGSPVGFAIRAEVMTAVVKAARRGSDLVVADLPRGCHATEVVVGLVTTALVVVPAEVSACAAAARVIVQLRDRCGDLRLVVRGPGRLTPEVVGDALDLPVAAYVRSEPAVAGAWERGEPPGRHPGALSRCTDRLLDALLGSETVNRQPEVAG